MIKFGHLSQKNGDADMPTSFSLVTDRFLNLGLQYVNNKFFKFIFTCSYNRSYCYKFTSPALYLISIIEIRIPLPNDFLFMVFRYPTFNKKLAADLSSRLV